MLSQTCVFVCKGMEDFSSGVLLAESADDRSRFAVGTSPAYSTHPDCLHLHLFVPVQHSTGVPLPARRKQRRQGRYMGQSFGPYQALK